MYLVLIIYYIDVFAILQDEVLKLYELFRLPHEAQLIHASYLKCGCVNSEALVSEICVKEAPENHDLIVIQSETS